MARSLLTIIQPGRASQLLSRYVPEYIDFHRSVIPGSEPVTASTPKPPSLIFGSVTTADITENIMAVLNMKALSDEELARVVLRPEDVRIMQKEESGLAGDAERIKALGEYTVIIQIKGGDAVERTVRVLEQA